MNNAKRLLTSDCGQGTTEYAFLLILIALAAMGAANTIGSTVNQYYIDIVARFP